MRYKKTYLFFAVCLVSILSMMSFTSGAYDWSISSVNITIADDAGVDVKQTVIGSNATGATLLINITANRTEYGTGGAGLNCTVFAYSVSTANSTELTGVLNISNTAGNYNSVYDWGNATNSSANSTWGYINITNQILQDASDYTILARCINQSGTVKEKTVTNIVVDNSIPQVPDTLVPVNNFDKKNSSAVYFQSAVNNWNTTSCTFSISTIGGGTSTTYTGTQDGATCIYSHNAFAGTLTNGMYYWTMTASDGRNTTISAVTRLSVTQTVAGGGLPSGTTITPESKEKIVIWIVAILIIAGVIYLIKR